METLTTNGVRVSVETFYQATHSDPMNNKYIHAYRITIINENDFPIQLLRRYWHILDSNGRSREIEGEGVVGKQPILKPGEVHRYVSWSPLATDVGKMYGTYLMIKGDDDSEFSVKIPEFLLVAPFKMN
ncbi:MAG: Co2+/Mg2+ efflux protein ApaG [Bacteroidota bacterium]